MHHQEITVLHWMA